MKKKKIIIGSRGSKLALIYAQKVKNEITKNPKFKNIQIHIKKIVTKGDKIKDIRLSDIGGKGLFSKNIEHNLLKNKIDIAVHALKDMPAIETKGLSTCSFLTRNDPREILISNNQKKLNELKKNSIIGTSSFRREFQIKNIKKGLICKIIRGNVDTRLEKLKKGFYDAIILSCAGLKLLNLEDKITQIFSVKKIIPSAGQGIIAMQCRENDLEIFNLLKTINDKKTYICAKAERNVLKILEGSCETAVGVHASLKKDRITIEAELFSLDGSKRYYEKRTRNKKDFFKLSKEIGKILKTKSQGLYRK